MRPSAGWCQITMLPSAYFRRQCYVSTEPEDPHVAVVADFIGSDRILFASDFPHYDAVFPGAVQTFVAKSRIAGRHAASDPRR